MLTIALLAGLALQEGESIPKGHKLPYVKATEDCEKAAALIDSDPALAQELLTGVLDTPRVEKRECRLRYEMQSGTYSKWYDFYPSHFRGRARLRLAAGVERATALRHLQGAVTDFEDSVRRGYAPSREFLLRARAQLKALESEGTANPRPQFESEWNAFLNDEDFAGAKAHVQKKGAFLDPDKLADYLTRTNEECEKHLTRSTTQFIRNLPTSGGIKIISEMRMTDFMDSFALPPKERLTKDTDLYLWCLDARLLLEKLRKERVEQLNALFSQALQALAFAENEPRAFRAFTGFAHEILLREISDRAEKARDAGKDERRRLRSEADELRAHWSAFDDQVKMELKTKDEIEKDVSQWLADWRREMDLSLDGFPQDAEGIDALRGALEASVGRPDPEEALRELETNIDGRMDGWGTFSVESRRDLITLRIVAASLRAFLGGETDPKRVADSLDHLKPRLREFRARIVEMRYGPKVQKVFDLLSR